MLPFQDRYSRQRKLPEVGKLGQERIEQLEAVVRGGPEATIAALYLERAGAARVVHEPGEQSAAWPHAAHFRHAGPTSVARGAWVALQQLKRALAPTQDD